MHLIADEACGDRYVHLFGSALEGEYAEGVDVDRFTREGGITEVDRAGQREGGEGEDAGLQDWADELCISARVVTGDGREVHLKLGVGHYAAVDLQIADDRLGSSHGFELAEPDELFEHSVSGHGVTSEGPGAVGVFDADGSVVADFDDFGVSFQSGRLGTCLLYTSDAADE